MASERIIFGREVSETGNYRLCWVTSTEAGEIVQTVRNVVVTQNGPFFYMQFADALFKPYPCDHEGLRCDLLDPNAAWLLKDGAAVKELQAGDHVREGDFTFVNGDRKRMNAHWFGLTVSTVRLIHRDARIYREAQHPFDMENLTACDLVAGTYDFDLTTLIELQDCRRSDKSSNCWPFD